jgi:hypothetical protein
MPAGIFQSVLSEPSFEAGCLAGVPFEPEFADWFADAGADTRMPVTSVPDWTDGVVSKPGLSGGLPLSLGGVDGGGV